jgi:16S rRNA (guanine966-N2)-methyltransferase
VAGVAKLLRRDATALGQSGTMGVFDLVFIDPPYGRGLGEAALASAHAGGWLAPGATVVLEDSSQASVELPQGFSLDERRVYGAAALHLIVPA